MPTLRRYLIAGLLLWLPLGVTVLVVKLLVDFMDKTLLLIPERFQPDVVLGFHIPGLGLVLSVAIVLFTGVIVANFFGKRLLSFWEAILAKIPLVRTIYHSVKQVVETLLSSNGKSFRKVMLIEYPRKGIWTLAFQTGHTTKEIQNKTGHKLINVFVPTTPNPTSGFFVMLPVEDVIELDLTVEAGLKMIVSMGVIMPGEKKSQLIEDHSVAKE